MKLTHKLLILVLGSGFISSCTDLNTVPEGSVITSDQVTQTALALPGRISADINGMYALIGKQYCIFGAASGRADDAGYPSVCQSQDLNGPDMVSDDSGYNWFTASSQYADRADTYANPYMRWAVFYNQLKLANDILKTIPTNTVDPALKVYKAQARAVRAFDYLSLVPYFQFKYKGNEDKPSVPIVTEIVTADPSTNPRAALKDVYKLILADLTAAITDLEGYSRGSKGEIDQKVAYGLRARANLYMENWADAAADADKAMAGYTPYSRDQVSSPRFISANDQNWMWAIIITPTNMPDPYPSWPSTLGSFSGNSYSAGVGCYKSINVLLFNKIPTTDVRKGWWVDDKLHSSNMANQTWTWAGGSAKGDAIAPLAIPDIKLPFIPYTNVKFGQYDHIGGDINAGDWCIMRVEEMILIKAEATAMAGNLQGGKDILKSFVTSYRDPSYSGSSAGDAISFQNDVWLQRRIELWGEGFSMSDIMRLGKNIVRYTSTVTSNFPANFKFNIAATDGWLLMRIPQKETNNNLGIPLSANNKDGSQPKPNDGAGLTDGIFN
jgi:hypothetical protein